jgi:hypothetical protein
MAEFILAAALVWYTSAFFTVPKAIRAYDEAPLSPDEYQGVLLFVWALSPIVLPVMLVTIVCRGGRRLRRFAAWWLRTTGTDR